MTEQMAPFRDLTVDEIKKLVDEGRDVVDVREDWVCQVGERSAVASEMAVALGVKDVVNFRGGTKAWRDAGLPLEKP